MVAQTITASGAASVFSSETRRPFACEAGGNFTSLRAGRQKIPQFRILPKGGYVFYLNAARDFRSLPEPLRNRRLAARLLFTL